MERWVRVEKALSLLITESPATDNQWVSYHIHAMLLLKENRLDEAEPFFAKGSTSAPPRQRCYFESGLALLRLKQQKPEDATQVLEQGGESFDLFSNVIRFHVFGAANRMEQARKAANRVREYNDPHSVRAHPGIGAPIPPRQTSSKR